ncbi:DUF1353 domain-containing protein [Cognatiyoonia sp. IB215446]|uniref:DUF1353 domain-containing protein n=1 Tax=Cognatiyoonia sp. IB215446 TaxID=3097355 RepID=UPI002A0DE4B8|nr:DUF1353 domain-containing protein [Cognatiyoonia sp. IB215446]MDX8347391.1 DUF1353 domain-containing protein [Cognatiyoonia sp. IB215446]
MRNLKRITTISSTIAALMFAAQGVLACGTYEGRLILEDVADQFVRDDPDDIGHTEFQLLSPYTFIDCNGTRHTVPPYREIGGETVPTVINGASIPPSVWSLVGGPWSGRYRNAAVIHDYLVETRYSSSDVTHRIFYDAMVTSGTPAWKASLMYYAVLKGGAYWEEGSAFVSSDRVADLSVEDLEEVKQLFLDRTYSPEEIQRLAEN